MSTIKENEDKLIYKFEEGNKELKYLLGGKGAGLAEMTRMGLNIPPGFTITMQACHLYFEKPEKFMKKLIPRATGPSR